jgi:hypothetical protein
MSSQIASIIIVGIFLWRMYLVHMVSTFGHVNISVTSVTRVPKAMNQAGRRLAQLSSVWMPLNTKISLVVTSLTERFVLWIDAVPCDYSCLTDKMDWHLPSSTE